MNTDDLFYKGEAKDCKNCFYYRNPLLGLSYCTKRPSWLLKSALDSCDFTWWQPNKKLYHKTQEKEVLSASIEICCPECYSFRCDHNIGDINQSECRECGEIFHPKHTHEKLVVVYDTKEIEEL